MNNQTTNDWKTVEAIDDCLFQHSRGKIQLKVQRQKKRNLQAELP